MTVQFDKQALDKLLDETLKDRNSPLDEAKAMGLVKQMAQRIFQRALQGELTHHHEYLASENRILRALWSAKIPSMPPATSFMQPP